MKKLLLLLSLFAAVAATAQGRFKLGLGGGQCFATQADGAESTSCKGVLFAEGRYSLPVTPLDLGFYADVATIGRRYPLPDNTNYTTRSITLMATAGWRYGSGPVVPYAGVGAGFAFTDRDVKSNVYYKNETLFCFMPRMGVRLFGFLDAQVAYQFAGGGFSHADAKLGIFF